MEQPPQTKRERLFESFRALVTEEHLRSEQRCCVRCGAAMQFIDVTFWLHETDMGCSARLPFCLCEETSIKIDRTLEQEFSMNAGVAASPINRSWKELYRAALFETNKGKLSERIAHAEWALALRARELFHAGDEHLQERQAVDAAIHALHALRSTTTNNESKKGMHRVQAA